MNEMLFFRWNENKNSIENHCVFFSLNCWKKCRVYWLQSNKFGLTSKKQKKKKKKFYCIKNELILFRFKQKDLVVLQTLIVLILNDLKLLLSVWIEKKNENKNNCLKTILFFKNLKEKLGVRLEDKQITSLFKELDLNHSGTSLLSVVCLFYKFIFNLFR